MKCLPSLSLISQRSLCTTTQAKKHLIKIVSHPPTSAKKISFCCEMKHFHAALSRIIMTIIIERAIRGKQSTSPFYLHQSKGFYRFAPRENRDEKNSPACRYSNGSFRVLIRGCVASLNFHLRSWGKTSLCRLVRSDPKCIHCTTLSPGFSIVCKFICGSCSR